MMGCALYSEPIGSAEVHELPGKAGQEMTGTKPGISVVLPAYNEEENIGGMLSEAIAVLGAIVPDYEIIVVDDGSSDGTAQVVKRLASQYPQVRLVQHQVNRGYGAALYSGFLAAGRDFIFMTDSDRQFDLRDFGRLLTFADSADMVIGYRAPRVDPWHRRLFGWGWSMLTNILFGYTARDVDCAFKLFKREIVDNIQIQSRGATFSAEFLVRAKRKGDRIQEVPVRHLPRPSGRQTGARLDVILRAFRELVRFRIQLWSEALNRGRG